ncbi:sortase-associated OmpA-like protein PdsO [Photobacterium sp. 2_MG-2023]|uniref:sortase-associated OmpA-like protein PdsO n=1 Tax=Photobacterium sp. 2_MG-2023 TaxID=3062663 RepID=UPI0026E3801B|nr:sortase-associated OmpA-like protein PdsO [Photobacterium sp. 2_MG-2023]MDO6582125.1 sortase-associated OmpA-like protein PdsO [Photobacterium sp. 2_MG-2023]
MNTMMKKQALSLLVVTAVMGVSTQVHAGQQSTANTEPVAQQEQWIGMGSGAAVGGLVGGPVGAVIGAMVGGIMGTAVGQEGYIASQTARLSEQQKTIFALNERNAELEPVLNSYQEMQHEMASLRETQQKHDMALAMNVHFRTGSAVIEPHFQAQLDEIAELMKQSPEINWELSGYADRRGGSERNQVLSEERATAVRDYLESRGANPLQIVTIAYGEEEPLKMDESWEYDFFDRRVTLRSQQGPVQTAQSH